LSTTDYQALLVEHLELIDRVIHYVARRHHVASADVDEFASLVHFKLVDRDFCVLRKFEGRSTIATYLTTVIERLYLDFCITRWGKWRPSASARRLGAVAMLLEQLLVRDGLSFDEAVGTLHTNHGVSETRDELHALLILLPPRALRRPGSDDEPARSAARGGAHDPAFDRSADRQLAGRIEIALARGVARLSDHDRLILKLRYLNDLSVASIARLLQTDSKPLYRRLDHVFRLLRRELAEDGVDARDIDRIVGHPELMLGRLLQPTFADAADNAVPCPSNP
jgi:RNA polymerase sigma factor (sigma-70 family)